MASNWGVLPNNPNTWIPYSSTITKTIYDPCPYGYRVPKDGSWNGFPINTWTLFAVTGGTSWPKENGGWWPTTGYRLNNSAVLYNIGYDGRYWSSSLYPSYVYNAYYLIFNYTGWVDPSPNYGRSIGFSVRCIEEEENKQSQFLGSRHTHGEDKGAKRERPTGGCT